jgi:TonB-linked SusC/RagA family outer membrane protein
MKLKLTWLLTLFMAFVMQFSFAQEKMVTGTVTTESDGLPLPGASVIVKGTTKGAQTDFDGKYTIGVNSGDVLVISYVGMEPVEVTIGASNVYDVVLKEGNTLDEVVVIGYGTTTKQSFAGTASVVKTENIETKNYSNVTQSLAGEAAGVTVINTSGQPGTTSTVRIRGFASVNGNRSPLYVIDGVPIFSATSLNAINPSDIKSTTILKDATATAIYGSRGANGVVLITTKSGSANESYIEVDVRTGINTQAIPRYDVVRSPEEAIGYVWEGLYGRAIADGVADPVGVANANLFSPNVVDPGYNMWNVNNVGELIDPATRTVRNGVTRRYTPQRYEDAAISDSYRTQVDFRMGGGNEDTRYFISGGYLDQDGVAINTNYTRYTSRLNVTSKVKEWLSVTSNLGYAYSKSLNNGQTDGAENLFEFADKMQPFFPVFLRDNNYQLVPDPIFGGNQYDYGTPSGFRSRPNADLLNPIGSALFDFNGSERHEFNGSFKADFKITDNLKFETSFGAQYFNDVFKSAGNQFYGVAVGNGGDLFIRDTERFNYNFLQLLRYNNQFGDHNVEVLAAHETNDYRQSQETVFKGGSVIPGIYELDNYVNNLSLPTGFARERTLESYFGQANYNFRNTYFFTASFRRDGSSRFADPANRWDNFGSVGVAWVLSNEGFLSDSNLISFLKLKASYGIAGDEAGVSFYTGENTFEAQNLNGSISIAPDDLREPVTWEISKTWQVGLEATLGNFLDVNIDYFVKDTDNLFFDQAVSLSAAPIGGGTILVNDGVLRNYGLEFDFTGHIVKTEDFKLDLNVNGAMYDNEMREMPIDVQTGEPAVWQQEFARYGLAEGRSIFDFFMREWAGVDPSDGAPMWYVYYDDVNGNGILDLGEGIGQNATTGAFDGNTNLAIYRDANPDANLRRTTTKQYAEATSKFVDKSSIPDVSGAFRLSANYKNWNLSTQFTYSLGGWAYDAQYAELMQDRFGAAGNNYHTDIRNRWQQPGDITNVPRLADGLDQQSISTSTRFLTRSDFLALNNVVLGYTFPKSSLDNMGIDLVNLFVSGDNLFIFSKRDGFNPTTSETGNTGRGLYAPLTTITFGVKVKF